MAAQRREEATGWNRILSWKPFQSVTCLELTDNSRLRGLEEARHDAGQPWTREGKLKSSV